ncbi:FAD-dependent monooxygenase [Corallincola luteus]|uniref:FAD-dependent monooxygenase n=1 Tax=Corallincola luteus TaxID=1775177 RepID=UPI00196ABDB4|nr:FAD-dependent monooxygenase [Corallincola luteus]
MERFELIVVGGGMVGASLALKVAMSGVRVALIEKRPPAEFEPSSPCGLRVSALNRSSESLLDTVGAWPELMAMRSHCYRRLSVWQQGGSRTDFDASEVGEAHLGYLVENDLIQRALWNALEQSNVALYTPDSVVELAQESSACHLKLASGAVLQGALVVAADGADSKMRSLAGIGVTGWDYQQHALVVAVKLQQPAPDITWQSYVESGPRAFLPLADEQASLVWYHYPHEVKRLRSMAPLKLAEAVREAFPDDLPEFEILNQSSFPLKRQHANHYVSGRVVLVGDAAHVINPMAGQGVNLGFQDVIALSEQLAAVQPEEWPQATQTYERKRRGANLLMMSTMDGLYATFGSDKMPLRILRSVGLWAANRATPLKASALRYAMGLPLI